MMCLEFLKRYIYPILIPMVSLIVFVSVLYAILIMRVEDVVGVIFSALVALATVVYAILTWSLTAETKKMREAQTEPCVVVYLEQLSTPPYLFDVWIKNVGLGVAKNIRFEVKPDIEYSDGKHLSGVGFIKNGLPLLAPGQDLDTVINLIGKFEEVAKEPLKIKIRYESASGKPHINPCPIDFSQFIDVMPSKTLKN